MPLVGERRQRGRRHGSSTWSLGALGPLRDHKRCNIATSCRVHWQRPNRPKEQTLNSRRRRSRGEPSCALDMRSRNAGNTLEFLALSTMARLFRLGVHNELARPPDSRRRSATFSNNSSEDNVDAAWPSDRMRCMHRERQWSVFREAPKRHRRGAQNSLTWSDRASMWGAMRERRGATCPCGRTTRQGVRPLP